LMDSAEITEILDSSIKDIDARLFSEYFKKEFDASYGEKGLTMLTFNKSGNSNG